MPCHLPTGECVSWPTGEFPNCTASYSLTGTEYTAVSIQSTYRVHTEYIYSVSTEYTNGTSLITRSVLRTPYTLVCILQSTPCLL